MLRLTPGARGAFSSGRIFSLVSSDAESLSSLCMNVFGVWSAPLRIGGEFAWSWKHIKWSVTTHEGTWCMEPGAWDLLPASPA